MKADDLRDFLNQKQVDFTEDRIQLAARFRGPDGEIFCVYDSGKFVPQGNTESDLGRAVKEWATDGAPGVRGAVAAVPAEAVVTSPIFIVYGHDIPTRDALELLLRRMGLEPIVLALVPAQGDTIIEKLEHYLGEHGDIGYACVLLTPDDEGHIAGKPEEKKYRARQNVVLELGMVLARLGRRRVAILHKQSIELPGDIDGLIWIPFQERLDEATTALYKELQAAGYKPRADVL